MAHLKTRRTMRISQPLWLPVAAMLALGHLTGCYNGNIAASGDRPPSEPVTAAPVSTKDMAPVPEAAPPEMPEAAASSGGAEGSGGSAGPQTSLHDTRQHSNYEYHTDDVLSAPPNARNGPRWDERLQPEYHRHLSRIDDTVQNIRERSQLEQLRREETRRESDKADRTVSLVDDFRRDRQGSSRYRY